MVNKTKVYLALLGIPLIISLWESLFTMKVYQLVFLIIFAIIYNTIFWKLDY